MVQSSIGCAGFTDRTVISLSRYSEIVWSQVANLVYCLQLFFSDQDYGGVRGSSRSWLVQCFSLFDADVTPKRVAALENSLSMFCMLACVWAIKEQSSAKREWGQCCVPLMTGLCGISMRGFLPRFNSCWKCSAQRVRISSGFVIRFSPEVSKRGELPLDRRSLSVGRKRISCLFYQEDWDTMKCRSAQYCSIDLVGVKFEGVVG